MKSTFSIDIENYPFSKKGITDLRDYSLKGEDWPIVYILCGNKEAYVGETQNAFDRMNQHFANPKRHSLKNISLILSDSFNKSAILDIENMLITHMHADGKYELQNSNGGQSKLHDYYQRSLYRGLFEEIWKKLQSKNIVEHNLFEIENSEIFKFSPFKELTNEQYIVVNELLEEYVEAMKGDTQRKIVVHGGAGTGKSLIAIYFINMLVNILNNNFDYSDIENLNDEESFYAKANLIKNIKTYGNTKIGFVIAVPSFKDSVKKVFHSIKELKHIDIISPSEATRGDYDVLIVDEAHRLKRREKLTNYGTHDNNNRALGLPIESTELDWVKTKANKMLVLFYDDSQSVKESDILASDFKKIIDDKTTIQKFLNRQLRVKGGNEYIDFVNSLFTKTPIKYVKKGDYDLRVFDDCHEMMESIKQKDKECNGLCRMVSGYSFYWRVKARDKSTTQYKQDYDFAIDGYKYCWNDDFNAYGFITNPKNLDRIGCIYTVQGHDLNYCGVIFGEDISYNPNTKQIEYHPDKFLDTYSKSSNVNKTIQNIINAYKVLLTRGVYGTFIYAVDKKLREYLKTCILTKKGE